MKTFLSMLLIVFTIAAPAQNEENNNVIQQQVNLNNNIGNFSKNPSIQINTRNINIPSINLTISHINKEKVSPKGVEYFRIKTGNYSSGSVSHKSKKENRSFHKKALKPIRCWVQRTFRHTTKFQLSCECFKF